jgi:flagellar basal body-associated protein FliL
MSSTNEQDAPKVKKGMPKIVVYVIAGVLAAVLFGGGIFFGSKFLASSGNGNKNSAETKKTEHSDESAAEEEESDEIAAKKVGVVIAPKEDIVFNPKDAPSRYVVVGIGIEVTNEEEKKIVEDELMIPINAAFLNRLRSYTLDEIQSLSSSDSLRIILKKEIRPLFHEAKLKNIYISKFIIQ